MLVLPARVFIMRVSLVTLALSFCAQVVSAHAFGLAGAAVGSVTAIYCRLTIVSILRASSALCTGFRSGS